MNRKNIIVYVISALLISLIVLCTNCFAYEWGVKSTYDEVELVAPYPINATLGEFRKKTSLQVPRFHFGVDIYGRAGNLVYAIEEGTVISKIENSDNGGYADSITIGRFTYTHLRHFEEPNEDGYKPIEVENIIEKGQAIAYLRDIDYPHLHLQEKDAVGGQVVNPLRRVGGLSGYSDNGWPMVFGFKFYRDWNDVNSTKEQIDNFVDKVIVLDGNVDILAKTKDRQNQAMTVDTVEGKKVTLWPSQNTGVYQIGYQVQNQFQVDNGLKDNKKDYVVRKTDQIKFDGLPQGDTPAYWVYDYQENLIGQSSDKISIDKYYCYWATNKMYSNGYWDTTQHPDGKYTVSVLAWDIAGNGGDVAGSKGAASQKVIINNKRPVIKSISVADNSDADKMFKAGDKIELAIEFDEQLNPDKLPVLYIGAPKADGEKVEWIKVNGFFQMNRALS